MMFHQKRKLSKQEQVKFTVWNTLSALWFMQQTERELGGTQRQLGVCTQHDGGREKSFSFMCAILKHLEKASAQAQNATM